MSIERSYCYNTSLVYCLELAPGTVSLTGNWVRGNDSKQTSNYTELCHSIFNRFEPSHIYLTISIILLEYLSIKLCYFTFFMNIAIINLKIPSVIMI